MRVTFLGTGAAGGVPLYGCHCPACQGARQNPSQIRRPCSAAIETQDTSLVLDAGLADLHERFPREGLDAIVLTHFHPDHVQGLFHLRWGCGLPLPVYCPLDPEGCADLYKHPGLLEFRPIEPFVPFAVGSLELVPLPLVHSKPTLGYAVKDRDGGRFAYLTDTCGLPPRTLEFLQGWGPFELALDCTTPPGAPGRNHNDWDGALELARTSGAHHTFLTHVGHALDAWLLEHPTFEQGPIRVARDGRVFEIGEA